MGVGDAEYMSTDELNAQLIRPATVQTTVLDCVYVLQVCSEEVILTVVDNLLTRVHDDDLYNKWFANRIADKRNCGVGDII